MLTLPGHHIGDSWFFVHDRRIHCYFLVCTDVVPRHTAWDIGHASSVDLKSWEYHGVVLTRGAPESWDGLCLATGTVIRHGGRFWMAYTGNWFGPSPAVGVAVSDDLHRWTKLATNPVTAIDERFYTADSRGRRVFPHWRDPFLFEVDGRVHQLVCATAKHESGPAGAIGVARTSDMMTWKLLPPLRVTPFAEELECPQIVGAGKRFYLVFSTPAGLLVSDEGEVRDEVGFMYCMVGSSPLGPFEMVDPEPIVKVGYGERPYAGRVVEWNGEHVLMATIWSDAGDRISDPILLELTPSGINAR